MTKPLSRELVNKVCAEAGPNPNKGFGLSWHFIFKIIFEQYVWARKAIPEPSFAVFGGEKESQESRTKNQDF
jgi:hypothetical protein